MLCSTLSEEYADVLNTVIKLVNFLRASSSHQHRLLQESTEVDADSNDLLLHCNIRWLRKGKVLARFWAIRNEKKMWHNRKTLQNPFLVRNVTTFSQEATQIYKWADTGSLQMELVDLQANVALREQWSL